MPIMNEDFKKKVTKLISRFKDKGTLTKGLYLAMEQTILRAFFNTQQDGGEFNITEYSAYIKTSIEDELTAAEKTTFLLSLAEYPVEEQRIDDYPFLAKFVTDLMDTPSIFGKTFLLYELSRNEAMLGKLFQANSQHIQTLIKDDLCRLLPNERNGIALCSALERLAASGDGRKLLLKFFEEIEGLAETVTRDSLGARVKVVELHHSSTWSRLMLHSDGIMILTKLFDANPELVRSLTREDLGSYAFTAELSLSTIFQLNRTEKGRTLLIKLLDGNPELVQSLRREDLCTICNVCTGMGSTLPPLLELSNTQEGRDIIAKLFDINPRLMQSLTYNDLFMREPATVRKIYNETSNIKREAPLYRPFTALKRSPEGRAILNKVFSANPELLRDLRARSARAATIRTAQPPSGMFAKSRRPAEGLSIQMQARTSRFQGTADGSRGVKRELNSDEATSNMEGAPPAKHARPL